MTSKQGEVTQLLHRLGEGEREAEEQLIPLVYGELRRLASYYLRGERVDHTLQPTALVHEAYLRLTNAQEMNWQSRSHFFATAANVMRRILVDYARAQHRHKREGCLKVVSLDELMVASPGRSSELLTLDDALVRLSELDIRQCKVVELKFFGGLTDDEIAAVLGISTRTVKREWRLAKAWLYIEVNR